MKTMIAIAFLAVATVASASVVSHSEFNNAATSVGYPVPTEAQYKAFNDNLWKADITNKQEAAMALTHFLHESDGLKAKREYACAETNCPEHYRTPGCDAPGQFYYGRGYIQLTWCYNYRPASQDLYGDDRLVKDPDMVARDENVAWSTAFWFWKNNVHNRDGVTQGRFGATTRAINGGLECDGAYQHVAKKRFEMYRKIREAFGLNPNDADERGCYN